MRKYFIFIFLVLFFVLALNLTPSKELGLLAQDASLNGDIKVYDDNGKIKSEKN